MGLGLCWVGFDLMELVFLVLDDALGFEGFVERFLAPFAAPGFDLGAITTVVSYIGTSIKSFARIYMYLEILALSSRAISAVRDFAERLMSSAKPGSSQPAHF